MLTSRRLRRRSVTKTDRSNNFKLTMQFTWRWFGPDDAVNLTSIRQAGANGVVSALHHLPVGSSWPAAEIAKRQQEIAFHANGRRSGLNWRIVESLPVSEAIKTQTGNWREHIRNYRTSLSNLAAAGIQVICYNFMPVLDWTRTNLSYKLTDGSSCLAFDYTDLAMFDLYILQRQSALADYSAQQQQAAKKAISATNQGRLPQVGSKYSARASRG